MTTWRCAVSLKRFWKILLLLLMSHFSSPKILVFLVEKQLCLPTEKSRQFQLSATWQIFVIKYTDRNTVTLTVMTIARYRVIGFFLIGLIKITETMMLKSKICNNFLARSWDLIRINIKIENIHYFNYHGSHTFILVSHFFINIKRLSYIYQKHILSITISFFYTRHIRLILSHRWRKCPPY